MPMVHMRDLVSHARTNAYAVGAFEIGDLHVLAGVLDAAERCRAPVVLSVDLHEAGPVSFEVMVAAVEQAARAATVPVALQANGAADPDQAVRAISCGCNALSVRAQAPAFDRSVAETLRLVEIARGCGVPVEICDTSILSLEAGDPSARPGSPSASVDEIRAFVERTGVDFLRLSIDAGDRRARPRPDYRRLGRIAEALDTPLAVDARPRYGDDQLRRLIGYGVCMIACPSSLYDQPLRSGRETPEGGTVRGAELRLSRQTVRDQAAHCMRVWGSAGRAAEVEMQCAAWQAVTELIPYEPEAGASAEKAMQALRAGQQSLSRAPGVREVFIAPAPQSVGPDRYCWLVRYVDACAVGTHRNGALPETYADPGPEPERTDLAESDAPVRGLRTLTRASREGLGRRRTA